MTYLSVLIQSIFLSLPFFFFIENSNAQCDPTRDSLALMAFYQSTNGHNWVRDDNWLSIKPLDIWYGVVTNDSGCVKCLDFDGHVGCNHYPGIFVNLTGELPLELGDLTSLEFLSVARNEISGSIPSTIGNLKKLKTLILSDNNFSGEIPPEVGLIDSLEYLEVVKNNLSGNVPPEIGNLKNLSFFHSHTNNLSGCLDSNLLNLCGIDIVLGFSFPWSGNFQQFCMSSGAQSDQIGTPCNNSNPNTVNDTINEFCECSGSPILSCTSDSLILAELYKSTNGSNWKVNSNWLKIGQPVRTWWGVETNPTTECVTRITLDDNFLDGTLPTDIGDLKELELLSLNGNNLKDRIPASVGRLDSLVILKLANNNFSDTIPHAIYDLPKLRLFDITSNGFSGEIDETISNLKSLELFYAGSNEFSGKLPNSIGTMERLNVVYLNSNQLEGSIPEEVGKLTKLRELKLNDNHFSGEIPTELGQLSEIRVLDLSHNNLSGSIPDELLNCQQLFAFYLNNNKLTGNLPTWLPMLNVSNFRLNDNDFSGCIDSSYHVFCGTNINLDNNPKLPWTGDFGKFCLTDGSEDAQTGAYCYLGNSVFLIQDDCSCGTSSAMNLLSKNRMFQLFPNPANLTFNFKLEDMQSNMSISMQIFDKVGQLQKSETLYANNSQMFVVDISDLNNGFYTVQIITNNGTRRTAKLMVETNK